MKIKQYAELHEISVKNVEKMASKLDGATQCKYCKKWDIPQNSTPIYIPDGRNYKHIARKFCYVLDAIACGMLLDEELSHITREQCQECLIELKAAKYIKLKNGAKEDSLNTLDYRISIEGLSWITLQTSQKSELIIQCLKTLESANNAIESVAKAVIATSPNPSLI